jgi:hypothetical protein
MPTDSRDALEAWRSIVPLVNGFVEGLSEAELDRRRAGSPMTVRETVHHVVEANVVAASIVIAALGAAGSVYDWSWMQPFGKWMERMRYDRKPLEPSLRLLEALNAYVAAQIEPLADGLEREVLLRDEAGAEPHAVTVAEVLIQEANHARDELRGGEA